MRVETLNEGMTPVKLFIASMVHLWVRIAKDLRKKHLSKTFDNPYLAEFGFGISSLAAK